MKNALSMALMQSALLLILSAYATAETVVIPGSGNPEYVLAQLAKAFNSRQKEHQIIIPETTGTAGGLRAVTEGTAILARVGRPLKETERAGGITYHPLGRDPVVFVVGEGVSVKALDMAQILDIYTGKLTNWSELGGKPGTIRAIGREVTDASRQAIGSKVPVFVSLNFHENVKLVNLDTQMLELLDRFPNSIGFLNRSALSAAKSHYTVLTVNSVEVNTENITSGMYPFWLEFGLIYKENALTPAAREFLSFIESPDGAQVMRLHGVVLLKPI